MRQEDLIGLAALALSGIVVGAAGCSSTSTTTGQDDGPGGGSSGGTETSEPDVPDKPIDQDPVSVPMGDAPEVEGPGDLITMGDDPDSPDTPMIPDAGDFVLRDEQTGTLWNLRGQAFDGELAGAQLGQVASYVVFWFAWSTAHDGGEIWNNDTPNSPGEIQADGSGDCNVPCDEIRSGGPPPDGIPTLDHKGRWNRPKEAEMIAANDADYLDDSDMVNGVFLDGEARAYPHALLNWHENHIDQIGEQEFNMTYCPLTGSAILFPANQGKADPSYFYVSGRLFNDNLTMFERDVDQDDATFWNQVLQRGIAGPREGERLTIWPVTETTWGRWRQLHPDTLVSSADTGYSRSYGSNPYVSNQDPEASTLFPVSPQWESHYDNKSRVLAIEGPDTSRAYPFQEMGSMGDRVVINDALDDTAILVVYEAEHRMAVPFNRHLDGQTLTFEGTTAP